MKKYLSVIPLVVLLCIVVGCQDKAAMAELEEFKAQAALEEGNMALAKRFDKAWQEGDVESLKEIMSSDYIWHAPDAKDFSLEETLKILEEQMISFPDRNFIFEDYFAKGDKVVSRYFFRGTHTGDVENFPATGKKFEAGGIAITKIENGKIVELWEAFDVLGVYQQLGFELKPKEAGK